MKKMKRWKQKSKKRKKENRKIEEATKILEKELT